MPPTRLAVLGAATAAVGLWSAACGAASDAALPDAHELTPFLLSAADTGVPGAVTQGPVEEQGVPLSPTTAMLDVHTEGACADAIRAGLDTRILPHASTSQFYEAGGASLEIGLFSTGTVVDAGRIYDDIVTFCDEPIHDDVHGVTYAVAPVSGEHPGMRVTVADDEGRSFDVVILQAFQGNCGVLAAGHQLDEATVRQAFDRQMRALGEGLEKGAASSR